MKFYKEDDGDGMFSIHMENNSESILMCMCPSKRTADLLLRVLREGLSDGSEEMEADQTYSNTETQTYTSEETTTQTTTKEAVNEKSLIKLTTSRTGLRLISSNY